MLSKLHTPCLLLFLLTIISITGCGQQGVPNTELVFPSGKTSVEIPFTRYRDWIIIPVHVNNSKTLSFIFDTGAPIGILAKADPSIDFSIARSIPVAGSDPNKPKTVPLATGVTFKIGDLEIKNGWVAIGAAADVIDGTDGIIGKYLFENATISIDWDAQKLIITQPGYAKQPEAAMAIPLTMASTGHIYTTLDISRNGKAVSIHSIVDTGAKSFYSLEKSAGIALLESEPVLHHFIVAFGANGSVMGDMARGEVKISSQLLTQVPITFKDSQVNPGALARAGIHGNLGLGILDRFNITFALSENKLYLIPRKNLNDPFITNRTGIITKPGHTRVIEVAGVIPNSPADNLKIQAGDWITDINGKSVDSLNPHQIFVLLKAEGEKHVAITVERKGQKMKFDILLKESI